MQTKYILFFLLIGSVFTIISCSDSGTTTGSNTGELSTTGLKRLDQNTEGIYELWVSVQTGLDHDDNAYRTLGRFNIGTSGGLVDASGNSFSVNAGKIANLNNVEDGLITIESPGDNDTIPGNIRFLGGSKKVQGSTIVISLTMDYTEILGSIAAQFPTAAAKYLLASPTTGDTLQFNKGVWFTESTGGTPAGLTLPAIPDTLGWTYQAYVIDSRDSVNLIYNMGRFDSPNTADDYHQCEFNPPAASWQLPGQDWIQPNCPASLTQITDLAQENFIEMRDLVADTRFQLKKKIETLLYKEYPDTFIPKYSMVTFLRIPYSMALKRGRVQEKILNELSSGIKNAEEFDRIKADKLIRENLKAIGTL